MAEKKGIFTASGGMNQDDSLVTPAQETGGRSLFELGDYRYAANARIGSSRSDNFGDVENIKDTDEVTSYYRKSQVFLNPLFTGSLSPWLQLDDGPGFTAWIWGSYQGISYARLNSASGVSFTSQVLYQTGFTFGSTVNVKVAPPNLDLYQVNLTGTINIVFLNGSTIVEEVEYEVNDFLYGFNRTLDVPDGANGIGLRISGSTPSSFSAFSWSINFFYLFNWAIGTAPSGTEKTIGKFEDKEFLKQYYCNWNSYGDHTLRMYDYTTNSIYELMRWSGFNWESTDFVDMAKLDNWLTITDRRNKPRLFDTDDIADFFQRMGDEFREFHISFHKWAPNFPPICQRVYDTGVRTEAIYRKQFDFSYRYIYNGNLRSRWSPVAVCHGGLYNRGSTSSTISYIKLLMPGCILDVPGEETSFNYFDHDDFKFTQAVTHIEIAYREGELDVWKLWKRKSTRDGVTNKSFEFRNDGLISFIDPSDLNQPQDTVPLKAGTVESIDNRFVFGDCLNEYPYWDELSVESVSVNSVNDSVNISINSWISTASLLNGSSIWREINALHQLNFKDRTKYQVGIQFLYPEGRKSLTYTKDDLLFSISESAVKDTTSSPGLSQALKSLSFKIPDTCIPPEDAVAYQIMRTDAIGIDSFIYGVVNQFTPLVDNASAQPNSSATTIEKLRDRMASHIENTRLESGNSIFSKIDNPDYFVTKAINLLLRNNSIAAKTRADIRATKEIALYADASRILIDVNNWYNASKDNGTDKNNPLSKIFYNFRNGDRCRFIGSSVTNPNESQKAFYDVPILEFTGTAIIVEKPTGLVWAPPDTSAIPSNFVIEVYTPVTSRPEDIIFNETEEVYPILYPGTSLRNFSKRDWTWTNIAAATRTVFSNGMEIYHKIPFSRGDCYYMGMAQYWNYVAGRATGAIGLTSMTPFTDSIFGYWDHRNGRKSISYSNVPNVQFFNTQCRFGGKIIEESLINQINRFNENDQFIYPSEYGRIRKLINTSNAQVESVGSILLAIGEREAWSIYVNRTTLEDLSGKTQIAISDKVLGSYNTLLGSHGTLNPESVSVERGRAYWWDAIDGVWVRYGRDGLTEISFYKMRNWFRDLASLVISEYQGDNVPMVVSGYDSYNEELIVFHNHSSLPGTFRDYNIYKGVLFSEESTRWKTTHGLEPERIGKNETLVLMWKSGRLYRYEKGSGYSTFFGEKHDVFIEPVCNQEALNVKSWQVIAITATHAWSVDRFKSEYRGAKTAQESNLTLENFTEKEDTFYAEILNDENSVNVEHPILNGKKMRSKALRALLKLDPSVVTLSLLHFVTFGYIDSPKNP